jgi:hypothetical protein
MTGACIASGGENGECPVCRQRYGHRMRGACSLCGAAMCGPCFRGHRGDKRTHVNFARIVPFKLHDELVRRWGDAKNHAWGSALSRVPPRTDEVDRRLEKVGAATRPPQRSQHALLLKPPGVRARNCWR